MEYFAKLIREQRSESKLFWRYDYLNVETNKKDWFLSNFRINHVPNLAGKLNLIESDKHPKFFQSFEQDIDQAIQEGIEEQGLSDLVEKGEQEVKEIDNDFTWGKKLKLFRQQIDELSEKGLTRKEIAKIARVNERTIYRARKRVYLIIPRKTGRPEKIQGRFLTLLFLHVFKHPEATQQKRSEFLYRQLGQHFSQSTICRALRKNKLTHQVVPYRHPKQKSLMLQLWGFVEMIQPLLQNPYLSATDESGFPLNLAPRKAWGTKGHKVIAYKPVYSENYTLLLIIQNLKRGGIVHWELVKGAVNTETFANFLVNTKFATDDKYYLLLDNLPVHKTKKVKKAAIQKNIELIFLVSYFPQLNPAEEIFNVIKGYVRNCMSRTEEELRNSISQIVAKLNEEDLTKYFKDCLKFKID